MKGETEGRGMLVVSLCCRLPQVVRRKRKEFFDAIRRGLVARDSVFDRHSGSGRGSSGLLSSSKNHGHHQGRRRDGHVRGSGRSRWQGTEHALMMSSLLGDDGDEAHPTRGSESRQTSRPPRRDVGPNVALLRDLYDTLGEYTVYCPVYAAS